MSAAVLPDLAYFLRFYGVQSALERISVVIKFQIPGKCAPAGPQARVPVRRESNVLQAGSFHVTGIPALIIILVILALIITGIVTVVKKGKNKIEGK